MSSEIRKMAVDMCTNLYGFDKLVQAYKDSLILVGVDCSIDKIVEGLENEFWDIYGWGISRQVLGSVNKRAFDIAEESADEHVLQRALTSR